MWHPVRGTFPRSLLPLTVLAAAALLAGGSRAQAGYVTPLSFTDRPSADSFMSGAPQADPNGVGASSSTDQVQVQETDPPRTDDPARLESLGLPPSGSVLFGASSGGAGCPSPCDGAGAGNSSPTPAVTPRPPTDAPARIGALFLTTASRMPPPFHSRLFRPPRLS